LPKKVKLIPENQSALVKQRGYRLIGVNPNEVILAPKIAPLLRRLTGNKDTAIDYLRASGSPVARTFLAVYDEITLPGYFRNVLPIEAFCIAAKVDPLQLLRAIVETIHAVGAIEGSTIAALAHPDIMRFSVNRALTPEGEKDREWNLKHMGHLPSPKGYQVNVNVNANASSQAASQTVPVTAPSPENTIRRFTNRFNLSVDTQRALPEAKEPTVTVDAEYEDD
jgi:hypothetical protein